MAHSTTTRRRPLAAWQWGVWTLAVSALVLTSWTLGMAWLAAPVLGMPLGLWAAGLGLGIAAVLSRRWPGLTTADLAAWLTPVSWRLAEAFEWMLEGCASSLMGSDRAHRWMRSLACAHDRLPWWESPLRIGIDAPQAVSAELTAEPGLARVSWFEITSTEAQDNPNAFCEYHGLDAIVFAQPGGSLRVATLRRDQCDASMPDWTFDRPINLGTLFPHGADPAAVELAKAPASVQRAAIELVSALARSSRRLGLADRLSGRRPMPRTARMRALRPIDQARSDTPSQLASALMEALETAEVPVSSGTFAGAVSAWAASEPGRTPGFEDHARRDLLERAARLNPSCVRTQLRLASARFVARDDHGGLDALASAYDLLRAHEHVQDASIHAAFLDEALMQSPDEPASVGRVATGVAMLMVSTPADQLDYLRDDLLDEARYADWLIGRDPDTTLLDQVFRRLAGISAGKPVAGPEQFPRRAA